MPESMVRKLIEPMPAIHTGDPFGDREERISRVCDTFQVSGAMARIRLKGLGLLKVEKESGYVCLGPDNDRPFGYGLSSLYYDNLGNYIPEQPIDPPEIPEQPIKGKRRKKKSSPQ